MSIKLEKLVNKIFKTSYYPNSQNEGLICAFNKSREKGNPNNLHGITFSNSVGKSFNTTLHYTILALQNCVINVNIYIPSLLNFRKEEGQIEWTNWNLLAIINANYKIPKFSLLCKNKFTEPFTQISDLNRAIH